MTTPTSEIDRIAVDLDEAGRWTLANIVREYATLIKTYEEAVAENARLKAALDRYSEDEMLCDIDAAMQPERRKGERRVSGAWFYQDFHGSNKRTGKDRRQK
jgi:hypothetical protein